MPKQTLPLSDAQIKRCKPKNKPYRLFDGGREEAQGRPPRLGKSVGEKRDGRYPAVCLCNHADPKAEMGVHQASAGRAGSAGGSRRRGSGEREKEAAQGQETVKNELYIATEWITY